MSNVNFFLTKLRELAYLSHKVTFPPPNCVEISNQSQLLHIFPKSCKDLSYGKIDPLKDFLVSYKHLLVDESENEIVQELLKHMFTDTAEGIKLQRGQEYRFSDRFCNRKFSAKGIQNNITLFKSKKGEVNNIIRKVANVLNTREKQWNEKQKELSAIHIKEKMQKAVRQKDYVRKLFETCKSWGGPYVTFDELIAAIDAKPGKQKQIVKTELTFYRNTHNSDMIAHPDLFKLNKISHEEHFENLLVLLSDEDIACDSVADLPTNADALKTLVNSTIETILSNPHEIHFSVNYSCMAA